MLDPELDGDVLHVMRDPAETTGVTMMIVTHEMQLGDSLSTSGEDL